MNITINRKSISCIQIKKEKNKMKTVFTANSTRKSLSLDEMDMIVGGGSITLNGRKYSEEEFNQMLYTLAAEVGYDFALLYYKVYANDPGIPFSWESTEKPDGLSAVQKIERICKAFWERNNHADL